jgi:hypothetical protein
MVRWVMGYAVGDIRRGRGIDEFGGRCNPYEEKCGCVSDLDPYGWCPDCQGTGWKSVLVAQHDRWWVRLLKWWVRA